MSGAAAPTERLDLVGFGEAMVLVAAPVGSALADTPTAELHVAGAEYNVAAAVARFGLRAALCTRIGDDPNGARVRRAVVAAGLDDTLVTLDAQRPTGVFFRDNDPGGARRVSYYRGGSAASAMDATDAARGLGRGPRAVIISGLTAALGAGPRELLRAVCPPRPARPGAPPGPTSPLVALDANLRPQLGGLDRVVEVLRSCLPGVDLLLLGIDEADPLFGCTEPSQVFAAAAAAGVRETILKGGPDGCWYDCGNGTPEHLPSAATAVVDPVGAGDAFAGGYLAARLRGVPAAGAARLGSQVAAAVVAHSGDTTGLPDPRTARAWLTAVRQRS